MIHLFKADSSEGKVSKPRALIHGDQGVDKLLDATTEAHSFLQGKLISVRQASVDDQS